MCLCRLYISIYNHVFLCWMYMYIHENVGVSDISERMLFIDPICLRGWSKQTTKTGNAWSIVLFTPVISSSNPMTYRWCWYTKLFVASLLSDLLLCDFFGMLWYIIMLW